MTNRIGPYNIVREIGSGSFARAFLVSDDDGHCYVVKNVRMGGLSLKSQQDTFNEIEVLKRLKRHPYIVKYVDSFTSSQRVFIVMEYARCGDLSLSIEQAAKHKTNFSEYTLLRWTAQLAMAIAFLHGQRILHRDIKPQNVFLTVGENLLLGDFGISKCVTSANGLASTITGSPYYLSPEICRGWEYGSPSDMWAFGAVLFQLMNLRVPFPAGNIEELCRKIASSAGPVFPKDTTMRYSSGLIELCGNLMKPTPAERPSAQAVIQMPVIQSMIRSLIAAEESLTLAWGEEEDLCPERRAAHVSDRLVAGGPTHGVNQGPTQRVTGVPEHRVNPVPKIVGLKGLSSRVRTASSGSGTAQVAEVQGFECEREPASSSEHGPNPANVAGSERPLVSARNKENQLPVSVDRASHACNEKTGPVYPASHVSPVYHADASRRSPSVQSSGFLVETAKLESSAGGIGESTLGSLVLAPLTSRSRQVAMETGARPGHSRPAVKPSLVAMRGSTGQSGSHVQSGPALQPGLTPRPTSRPITSLSRLAAIPVRRCTQVAGSVVSGSVVGRPGIPLSGREPKASLQVSPVVTPSSARSKYVAGTGAEAWAEARPATAGLARAQPKIPTGQGKLFGASEICKASEILPCPPSARSGNASHVPASHVYPATSGRPAMSSRATRLPIPVSSARPSTAHAPGPNPDPRLRGECPMPKSGCPMPMSGCAMPKSGCAMPTPRPGGLVSARGQLVTGLAVKASRPELPRGIEPPLSSARTRLSVPSIGRLSSRNPPQR